MKNALSNLSRFKQTKDALIQPSIEVKQEQMQQQKENKGNAVLYHAVGFTADKIVS